MKKEYEFENMKERKSKVDSDAVKVPISLRLDGGMIALVKEEAERVGVPYQTLIQSILHQYVNGELISSKSLEQLKSAFKVS